MTQKLISESLDVVVKNTKDYFFIAKSYQTHGAILSRKHVDPLIATVKSQSNGPLYSNTVIL